MSAAVVSSWLYEKRPLKRPKLGPPDVYPQDPKQKEDELTAVNVKQGFSNSTLIQDEYGSARNSNITANKFGSYFSALLSKKQELNTLQDSNRKKQQINTKDNTLYVTSKSKNAVDQWFKDLSANTKTLSQLSRKVPIFNKKEEIFLALCEFQVPMFKAEWFLKMSCAYQIALSESNNKSKKRQLLDPSQEWTNAFCRFLREQYQKLCEHEHGVIPVSSGSATSVTSSVTSDMIPKQWQYYTQLARHLFEAGLLDRHDFLWWLLDLLEKIKSADDTVIGIVVPLLLQYMEEFTQNESLSRKLAYHCSKKLSQLVLDYSGGNASDTNVVNETNAENTVDVNAKNINNANNNAGNNSSSNSNNNNNNNNNNNTNNNNNNNSNTIANNSCNATNVNSGINGLNSSNGNTSTGNNANTNSNNTTPNLSIGSNQSSSASLIACFSDLMNCSHHRNVILGLSVIIQIITLDCPTSLIWLNVGDGKAAATLQGSPLDFLPCEPSNLPMPSRPHNQYLRNELRQAEEQIRQRSKMSEMHWSCDRWQQTAGTIVNKLLNVLDSLDRHCFDKIDSANSMDTLYSKIFTCFNANINAANNSANNSSPNTNANNTTTSEAIPRNVADVLAEDEPIVRLLCEWAVTTKRTGEHRALVVAKLLEKRQSELTADKDIDINEENDSDLSSNNNNTAAASVTNTTSPTTNSNNANNKSSETLLTTPIYQNLLLSFLDNEAPVYEDRIGINSAENKQAFSNLILLFGELIRCDVFSHDSYMCTLISRGQFSNSPNNSLLPHSGSTSKSGAMEEQQSLAGFVPNLSSTNDLQSLSNHSHLGGLVPNTIQRSTSGSSLPMFDPLSNHSTSSQADQTRWDMPSMDIDEANLDEDLDKLLQHIKAGQQNMSDQADILLPDSVGSDKEDDPNAGLGSHSSTFPMPEMSSKSATARHLLYTMHFPLPQDETSAHDCNQRHILLYGVGKAKDEARHIVKKITKEITKLFNRKSSMDISDGGKVKKHAIKEGFNFESAITKFQGLSTFDQHVVTTSCATAAVEMLNGVAIGSANYLPLIESIAFLFDLMEMALNVHGLIEFVIQMLKELVEVDIQLHQKCPILARTYSTSIGLYIVGVLYRYQSCLLVSYEETLSVFEGLWKLVRHVTNPSDCSSAERCILYYLYDLYSSYNHLRTKYHDTVSTMFSKLKSMNSCPQLCSDGTTNMRLNSVCMMEYLKNPKLKVDPIHIRQLNENSSERYSFVCNAIQCISMANDIDRLNEMSVLCAELTASCSNLTIEWLSALKALCCSSNHTCGYYDLLTLVEVGDLSIHDNLAVFTSILIARRCFSLKDFIINVAVPSLLAPCSDGAEDAESGARLTCHLLLCLFKTSDAPLSSNTMTSFATSSRYSLTSPGPLVLSTTPPNPGQRPLYIIKYPCDRYLLAAAHSTLRVEVVLTVLKAILVLGNSAEKRSGETKPKTDNKGELSISDILGPIGGDEDFGDLGILPLSSKTGVPRLEGLEKAGLSESAKYALRQICGQQWVHDRCLRGFMIDPEILNKLLLDPKLSHKEAQHLLNMICHPKLIATHSLQEIDSDQKQSITKILQNLDEWTIRVSWLQLQLMYAQCSSQTSSEVNQWLDNVAKATVDYFQNSSEESAKNIHNSSQLNMFSPRAGIKGSIYKQPNHLNDNNQKDRVWLIAPLISKLPSSVQGKILRVAANVLESGNWMSNGINQSSQSSYSSKSKDRGFQQQKNTSTNSSNSLPSLLSHQPFLSLVLMCLKGQDEQRESLLNSLYNQLSQAINEKLCDDIKAKHSIQEGLQLRLSLVGGMFDMIQRSSSLINDWAILLLQLISFTIVDPQINYEIFTTVLDMLAVLMHTTQVSDSSEPREETKKQYQNLIKKLKKELNIDRITLGIKMVKQLLPIVKQQCEVITCEPMGSLIDTKGNKIAGFDSIDKKQGLQVAEKQKVSPWDLLEGHKNPSPLSWTWFGAVRIERKPLRGEENHYLLSRHNHSIRKPTSYYIEPPPLPPEDVIEQIPTPTLPPIANERIPLVHHTTQMMPNPVPMPNMNIEETMRRDIMLETGPRATTPKKVKNPRRRRQTKNTNGNSGQQTPPIRMPTNYEPYGAPQAHPPSVPQNWYGSHPQQTPNTAPPPMQTQQAYYPQQQQMVTPRFTESRPVGHSKGALRAMLNTRLPSAASQFNPMQTGNAPNMGPNQGMIGTTVPNVYQGRQQVMMQRQIRPPPAQQIQVQPQQNPMYQMQNVNPTVPPQTQMHHMSVQPQANYGGPPPNMSFGNSMQMQNMDQSVQMQGPPAGHPPPPGYHNPSQQNQMLMRTQMQQQSQMVTSQPTQQFMAQRSQYAPNVTMGQMGPIDNRANTQVYNQQNNIQGMQNMNQWQQSGARPQQLSQLQRQLSGGNSQQHNPYHQTPY